MRFCLAAALVGLGMACATKEPGLIKTQVVTFPDGALVEYNDEPVGRAPAAVVLPQDSAGRLTGRAVVRAIPNTRQSTLYAQTRVFDPDDRVDQVPNQILIDMTRPGTNSSQGKFAVVESRVSETNSRPRASVPYTERSKPTQAVGLDRWNPGKY